MAESEGVTRLYQKAVALQVSQGSAGSSLRFGVSCRLSLSHVQAKRAAMAQQLDKECTFSPVVNRRKGAVGARRSSPEEAAARLYTRAKLAAERKAQRIAAAAKAHTFQPTILKRSKDIKPTAPVHQTLYERVRSLSNGCAALMVVALILSSNRRLLAQLPSERHSDWSVKWRVAHSRQL